MIAPQTRTLSPEQAAAAHAGPEGAFLIAAGPGTGKTATATERFCWLVEHRVPASAILAVTFNDRAADELRSRITEELGARRPDLGPEVLDGAWIGTFHGVCSRLLDEFAYLVGAPRELRVLDETGQRLFEQRLVARLRSGEAAPLDPDSFTALSVDDLDELLRSGLRFLLKLKGRGITPERFHKRALELHAHHWQNPVDAMARQAAHAELEAIEENIRSRFGGKRLPLTHNRRSYQEILDCATAFIRRDPDFADEPDLVATRGTGERPVTVVMAPDSRTEARSVAETIRRLYRGGRKFSDIAILAHSIRMLPRDFEDELRRQGIPYLTSGGSGFFDRQEIKDVLAMLRLTENPMDDGALVRVLQGPIVRLPDRGLYRMAARRFGRRGMRLRDCFEASRLEGFPEMDPKVAASAAALVGLTDGLGRLRDALTVADILNRLLEETGYLRWAELRAQRDGSPRALLNLRKVFQLASRFERELALAGIGDFVRHLDQVIDAELPVGEASEESAAADAVSLLTIHAAKGLEFPVVFLVNLRPARARDTERLFFDPDGLGFVMKNWRGEKHPRYQSTSPGEPAVKLAIGERRRIVYVGLTRTKDALYVTATREEQSAREVEMGEQDHFAEILSWGLAHPESANVVEAEQLELPVPRPANGAAPDGSAVVAAVLERMEAIQPRRPVEVPEAPLEIRLSFSQLHDFEICPVRYRFSQVWRVPAPPDDLLPRFARTTNATEVGAAVHEALAAWHASGGDLLGRYEGPEAGREMLSAYLAHPLAAAKTLGVEVGFNLRLGRTRVRGIVDRICELDGRTVLVDYKTNATMDASLIEAYTTQLRLYSLAAGRGLLPGGAGPRLVLFDLRRSHAIEVTADDAAVAARVTAVSQRIAQGDFTLGPENAQRPCSMCAFRPICADART
ncbi:MAG: ATP-dependent helicase [Chloroflexi bacterium]|nr:MAG: ATP-dependent helicase [Chloroflexota bacterium]